jgi:hypothetical protein
MYLGIDFLITPELKPYVIEINVGLPGGAQEYHFTHLVHFGKPSDIFKKIEETSLRVYGKAFKDYLHSLPFIESLKPFKIWMDGKGPFPGIFHPGLRLEDKWIQYQLIHPIAPMPETMVFDPSDLSGALRFLERWGQIILKRRVGRGGRGLQIITGPEAFRNPDLASQHYLLQKYIQSKAEGFTFSVRSVAFGGEFMCLYANLARRSYSNHGFLTFVSEGEPFGLAEKEFKTESFNQRSWEAGIWFGENEPSYLRHNLYEDEVACTTLRLPKSLYRTIQGLSVRIERFYEGLDLSVLPEACFEEEMGIRIS